jgi:hypothetical protein
VRNVAFDFQEMLKLWKLSVTYDHRAYQAAWRAANRGRLAAYREAHRWEKRAYDRAHSAANGQLSGAAKRKLYANLRDDRAE